jgi:hypothetical protein
VVLTPWKAWLLVDRGISLSERNTDPTQRNLIKTLSKGGNP